MTRLFLLFVANAIYLNAQAQCTQRIPSNAEVINTTVVSNQGIDAFWVCADGDLEFNGGLTHIFVEASGSTTVNGNVNRIVLQPGAYADVNGNQDTAFVSAGATLDMSGNLNVVYREEGAEITVDGIGNLIHDCADIVIEYSDAPADGCMVTATEEEEIRGLTIHPNPARQFIDIHAGLRDLKEIMLISVSGDAILQLHVNGQSHVRLPLDHLPVGHYVLFISDHRSTVAKRIAIVR